MKNIPFELTTGNLELMLVPKSQKFSSNFIQFCFSFLSASVRPGCVFESIIIPYAIERFLEIVINRMNILITIFFFDIPSNGNSTINT